MKNIVTDFFGVELKQYYFEEFKICGIPMPMYGNISGFILKFQNIESYLNYRGVLENILTDLEIADSDNSKYEIQRSKSFIINLLTVLRKQFAKKYN